MAPISQIFAWTALAAFATAIPLKPRQQQEMVTETDWVTVNVPVTLWVDENGTPLSTVASGGNFAAVPTVPSVPSVPSAPTTFSTRTSAPIVSNAVPTVTSTSTAAPVSTQIPIQPTPSSSTVAPYTPPTQAAPTTTAAPPPPASTTVATPSSAQDNLGRQATTAAAGGSSGSSGISASSSNMCTSTSDACEGDITHYDGGLGACGWNVNTNSDMQIALPVGFMGSQSNGNPYCGKSLTIRNPTTGQTVSATVGDKCMGCSGRSIDLTDVLFNTIGGGCDGRCSGFQWWFN